MKTISLLTVIVFLALTGQAQSMQPQLQRLSPGSPNPAIGQPPGAPTPAMDPVKEPANYLIRVEWKEPKSDPRFLEVLTAEGNFTLDTIQKNSVKINNNEVPTTLRFNGNITALSNEKGRMQLFLGRTVPYVTSTYGSGAAASASYQQMSVGLNSTFVATFGKPMIVQNDESGEISVLVKRLKD